MRIALERQDMRAQPVQEKPVVADDDRAAGEILDGGFQRLQGFHIQIVGRLVQQQHIAARAQQFRHMHAVALAARQQAHLLLLIGALEVEGPGIDAGVHFQIAQVDHL